MFESNFRDVKGDYIKIMYIHLTAHSAYSLQEGF
jgi:hypothetical protein